MPNITQAEIEEWVANATGFFRYTNILDGKIPKELYPQLREIMHRCKVKGLAYPVPSKGDGWWRPADLDLEEVCWWESDGEVGDSVILPMELNKYGYIPVPSVILVAGKYNAGKTAFCLNVVNLNLELWENKLNFFVSEGAEMMARKFRDLNSFIPTPPPFKMYRRTENFADVIDPDGLNVIDYLRTDMEKSYAVANKIFEIFNKLRNGVAVIAMQKPPGERKIAFGGGATAFEPTFYMAMDNGWIGFEKIKVPKILDRDYHNVKIEFKLKNGVNFYEDHEVYE